MQAKIAGAVADNASELGTLTEAVVHLGEAAVKSASRFLNFRRIAALQNGGGNYDELAKDVLATRSGRNQLYDSIVDRQRRGVLREEYAATYTPEERNRNRQILERQRQAVIRAEVAARRLDAARERQSNRPRPGAVVLDAPAVSPRQSNSTRLTHLKKDAEDALPALLQIRQALDDIDIDSTTGPIQSRISEAFGAGDDTKEILAKIDRVRDKLLEDAEEQYDLEARRIGELAGLYGNLFSGRTRSIWREFEGLAFNVIGQVAARFTIATLAGKKTGGVEGLLSQSLSSLGFGGFFANGGRPPVGKASIVGERGPELFMPHVSGTVIPNHALGGGPIVVHVQASEYFDARVERVSVDANLPIMQQIGQASVVGGAGLARSHMAQAASRRLGR